MARQPHPLTLAEHPAKEERIPHATSPLPFPPGNRKQDPFPKWDLLERLAYGSLPGIVTAEKQDRAELLKAYAFVHLEEEIRREAPPDLFARKPFLTTENTGHGGKPEIKPHHSVPMPFSVFISSPVSSVVSYRWTRV